MVDLRVFFSLKRTFILAVVFPMQTRILFRGYFSITHPKIFLTFYSKLLCFNKLSSSFQMLLFTVHIFLVVEKRRKIKLIIMHAHKYLQDYSYQETKAMIAEFQSLLLFWRTNQYRIFLLAILCRVSMLSKYFCPRRKRTKFEILSFICFSQDIRNLL